MDYGQAQIMDPPYAKFFTSSKHQFVVGQLVFYLEKRWRLNKLFW